MVVIPSGMTLQPVIVAISQPTAAWHRRFTLQTTGLPAMVVRPVMEMDVRGQWEPITLPGIHLPATIRLRPGVPTAFVMASPGTSTVPPQITGTSLGLSFTPVHLPRVAVGFNVFVAPRATILLGHRTPPQSTIHIQALPRWTSTRILHPIQITLTNTGRTWIVPTIQATLGGSSTHLISDIPLMPHTSLQMTVQHPPLLHWGINTIRWSAPGDHVTTTTVALPWLSLGIAGAVGIVVESINLLALAVRKRQGSPQRRKPT
jgi:hypothetical protein